MENDSNLTPLEPSSPLPPASAPVPQAPPAPTKPQVSAQPDDEWRPRFTGLQRTLTEFSERTGWRKLDEVPTAQEIDALKGAAQRLDELQQTNATLTTERATLLNQTQELGSQLTAQQLELRKFELVSQADLNLVPFVRVIQTVADEAEQKSHIEAFKANLHTYLSKQPRGGPNLPPPTQPAGAGSTNATDDFAEYHKHLLAGNTADAEAALDRWYSHQ